MYVCPKNSSQTVNAILYAIRRSTVLFSIFNFRVFQIVQNRKRVLNSRENESEEHRVLAWFETSRDGSTGSSPVDIAPS